MFQSAASSILELCVLMIVFIGVLGLAYIVTKKMAHLKQGSMKNKNMRIVEIMGMGPNQYLYIVQIGSEYHLFATSKDKVEYCNKIDDTTLKFEENGTTSFQWQLNQFRQNKQEKSNDDKTLQ